MAHYDTPRCGARWDPEGDHANGYRCTLAKGHEGDHKAKGLEVDTVHAWGRKEGIAAPAEDDGPRCPVCRDPLPAAHRDRRVASNGIVVCDRATCEERAGDLGAPAPVPGPLAEIAAILYPNGETDADWGADQLAQIAAVIQAAGLGEPPRSRLAAVDLTRCANCNKSKPTREVDGFPCCGAKRCKERIEAGDVTAVVAVTMSFVVHASALPRSDRDRWWLAELAGDQIRATQNDHDTQGSRVDSYRVIEIDRS